MEDKKEHKKENKFPRRRRVFIPEGNG